MRNQSSHRPSLVTGFKLLIGLAILAGCGRGGEPLTPAQVEAVRAACIGADLLRFAEEAPDVDELLATRRARLEEAEARLAEADAAHRALMRETSDPEATADAFELQARLQRSRNTLRDAQNDVRYAQSDLEQVETQARESGGYLELLTLHAAALAYADSALNFTGGSADSLRYTELSEAKRQEAEQFGRSRRALEARYRSEYEAAAADEFSKCNLQADELLQQGRR
ncbi:MAG: hypothetical protein JSW46_14760 [Gemmatimonadota bacterium]|nr:MAG: hypothetical protein JSW46_14760 [Gemmatimonadota bacterium]